VARGATDFGRIVAQTAKQVLLQRLREAEREATYGEFVGREGDIVSGQISQQGNATLIELGRTEALLPYQEQIPNERLEHGAHTRAVVIEVRKQLRGAQIVASRTHPALVVGLFALEVPEIEEGIVEIKGIAREAGHRTKVAVMSNDRDVDPVGACVGPGGQRARSVQKELHAEELERIDIVRWADAPNSWSATRCRRPRSPTSTSTRRRARRWWSSPTTSCRWRSGGRDRTPVWPPV
jgi:transcription termination/antitermination protein NusA